MQTQHIALVPEVAGINASELARVSAALQKQILRDVCPVWQISATVDAFPHLEDVPVGYWPIILAFGELGTDEGVHCDRKGQPYALIEMSPSWSLTASHVCIEMLIDPYGNRTLVGPSPRSDQGSVEFLVDICDPCEDARYAYTVNDVLVSDFCTPEFLAQIPSGKERYSFTGAVEAPYQVLPSGRLSWYDPATNRWWQRNHSGGAARDTDLGFIERRAGRGFSVNHPRAPRHLQATKMTLEAFESRMGIQRQRALHASQSQAHLLRVHLGNPGGVGDLAIDATASTAGSLGGHRSGLSDRPQVLAALIKASVGAANAADAPSIRRRSLAEALATNEEQAVVGAQVRGVGDKTQLSAGQPDPTGFEAIEDTVHAYEAKPPTHRGHPPPPPRDEDDGELASDESYAQQQARLHAEKRAQTARTAQAWAAQRPKDGRRTTIPPPMPRASTPSPNVARTPGKVGHTTGDVGRITSRVGPSIAPTAVSVGSVAPRPPSSIRDRVFLAAAVAAATIAAVAIYGSGAAPTSAPAAASSGSAVALPTAATAVAPQAAPTAAALPAAGGSVAIPAGSGGEHRSVEVLPAAKPPVESAAQGPVAPASHAPAAARVAKGPRPKIAGGNAKQSASNNPYDSPASEPLDQLVEERR
jgi:hypothetical protein